MVRGHEQVAVVLEHPGEVHVRVVAPVEVAEVGILVRLADLDRPVASEVEEHDGVAIGHGADGIALVIDDHEAVEVLVAIVGLGVHRLDRLAGGGERSALTMGVAPVAALDHRPVGFVAIHGDRHAPTT